jgi:hypothetical protein
MIGKPYKAHKDNVIDIFDNYVDKRQLQEDCNDIDFLKSRIHSLKNGKYTLAVAGEVKAGKSTFINALLGADILHADVLQATSAIVEIFKADKSFLKIKYADGKEEVICDDLATPETNEAIEKLRNICSVSDIYREIPTTLLNEYIIKSDGFLDITDDLINIWQVQSRAVLSDKKNLISQYLNEHSKEDIPVEIQFGYPLKWDFDELRIVDSPGVNALGGVQDTSFSYFDEANAIIFVHPIKPIESESFHKFIEKVIPNRSKDTLFLVLTHAGLYSDSDIDRLTLEAARLYKNDIPVERILVVDSLLKLIHDDLENGQTIAQIRNDSQQKKAILPRFKEIAEEQNKELKDILLEYSRFERMFEAIDKFSMQAPNLQLREVLDSIKKGYEDQSEQYIDKLDRLKTKKRNPQEFEEEINRIKEALSKYKNLMKRTEEEMTSLFTGRHTEWNGKVDELKAKYPELITQSETIELTRKNFTDALNEMNAIVTKFSIAITAELAKKLADSGKSFKDEHKITIPKVDLKAIEEKATKKAYRTENQYRYDKRGVDFWDVIGIGIPRIFRNNSIRVKVGEKQVYDEKLYLSELKNEYNKEFYAMVNTLPEKSKEVLEIYLTIFRNEITSLIDNRKKALEEEKDKKQSNNDIIAEIDTLQIKKKEIQPHVQRIEEILEDLK